MDFPIGNSPSVLFRSNQTVRENVEQKLSLLGNAIAQSHYQQVTVHVESLLELVKKDHLNADDVALIELVYERCNVIRNKFGEAANNFAFLNLIVDAGLVLLKAEIQKGDWGNCEGYIQLLQELGDEPCLTEKIHDEFVILQTINDYTYGLFGESTEWLSEKLSVSSNVFPEGFPPSPIHQDPVSMERGRNFMLLPSAEDVQQWFAAASNYVETQQYGEAAKMYQQVRKALSDLMDFKPYDRLSDEIGEQLNLHLGIYESMGDQQAIAAMGKLAED